LDVLVDNRAAIALYDRLGWQLLASTDYTLPDGRVVGMFHYAAPG
jgi:ribosomal protein S18 acetylase RimI-like enzyme